MNNRERTMAVLHYENYDRLPIVHFGYWIETLQKWIDEGHLTHEEVTGYWPGNHVEDRISMKLGLEFNWSNLFGGFHGFSSLHPRIKRRTVREFPDGACHVMDEDGAVVLQKPGLTSIPQEIDHLLKDRPSWEEEFEPRLQFTDERILKARVNTGAGYKRFNEGGLEYLQEGKWEKPYGIYCGSLFGVIRNWLGMVNTAYIQADDPELFDEIIDTVGDLVYRSVKATLEMGADTFDFGHFWEDICYKSGPLINPRVFSQKVGPHYKKTTGLLLDHGIDIVSLDCDGRIDLLVPIWLENGVNTMFPIEVGTWGASIAPWREKYGKSILGVGGVDKKVFSRDHAAVDAEIERLKPLVDLGGYIPCIDHLIPPDAEWDNVCYYSERMRKVFG